MANESIKSLRESPNNAVDQRKPNWTSLLEKILSRFAFYVPKGFPLLGFRKKINARTKNLELVSLLALTCILMMLTLPNLVLFYELGQWKYIPASFIVTSALYLLPVGFFSARLRWYTYLLTPVLLLVPVAIFVGIYYKDSLRAHTLMLVFESSTRNKVDVLGQVLVPLSLGIVAYTYLFYRLSKFLPRSISFSKGLTISVVASLLIFATPAIRYGTSNYIACLNTQNTHFFPFHLYYDYHIVAERLTKISAYEKNIESFEFEAYKKDSLSQKEIYVFVIGETSRYDHWAIHGYERPTSPKLEARNDFLDFTDVLSGGYNTMLSVPTMLTRATPRNFDLCYSEKSVIGAFKEAGFKTFWLANLASHGAASIDIHAQEADEMVYLTREDGHDPKLDESIVFKLDKILAREKANKLFFIIHTGGSHSPYVERFPDEFNKFTPSGKSFLLNNYKESHRPYIINGYDNSILYSDFFLDRLFNSIKKENAISWVWYASDHGEHLYDGGQQLTYHTKPDTVILHVPMFLWTSQGFQETYPEKYQSAKQYTDLPLSLNDLFYGMIGMANITFPEDRQERSISSPDYQVEDRWITGLERPILWDKPER